MDSDLLIKFDGELNQIDAQTLIQSLACIVTIVEEVNQELFSDQVIDIKINAISKGSFIIDIDIITKILSEVTPLLQRENVDLLAKIIAIITGIFTIRKFLKGEKPTERKDYEENIQIKNTEGSELTIDKQTFNIYNTNININAALDNHFEALNADPSIKSFQIIDKKSNSIFKADKEEFAKLTSQEKFEEILAEEKIIKLRTFLIIFKIVFDDKYKWEFIYKGNKIKAFIEDETFFKKIDKGEKFSKGDSLEVELEILQYFDHSVKTYLNKTYRVLKVLSHIPRDEQIDIDF
uniref:Uncharacterized protein n=1 Tax=Ignavibacterium album TaxID=591197 RepID=A0A7V2ZHH6_9BACT